MTTFVLQPKTGETVYEELQTKKIHEEVERADYAIVNLRGMVTEESTHMWKDGDLTASLVFTFRKLEK